MPSKEIIFITDSPSEYQKCTVEKKLLMSHSQLTSIEKTSFLSDKEFLTINETTIADRLKKGEEILEEISKLAGHVPDYNFTFSKKTQEQNLGIANLLLREYVEKKHALLVLLEKITGSFGNLSFSLNLSEAFSLFNLRSVNGCEIDISFREDQNLRGSIRKQQLKNNLYFIFDLKRWLSTKPKSAKKRVLFLVQSARHHHELLSHLYQLVLDSESLEPVIVSYSLTLDDTEMYKAYIPSEIKAIPFEFFRGYTRCKVPRNLFLETEIPQAILNYPSTDINYTQVYNMLQHVDPAICVTVGYQNTGRYLSDAARVNNIPCVSVDYSAIADIYTFQKFVEYDYKYCISESQKETWNQLKDPTRNHVITGFLKYDSSKIVEKELAKKLGLDRSRLTIFFASSHGFSLESKKAVLKKLTEMCERLNYNLVLKTHPLETDSLANKYVHGPNMIVVSHEELTSMECTVISDIVISQGSSIVLDALYYLKPYITLSNDNDWVVTDDMPISKEPFVFKAKGISEVEAILSGLDEESLKALQKQMKDVREHYLYQTDGNASARVLDHITKTILG